MVTVNDRMARFLATLIMRIQAFVATFCNQKFNTYSVRKQKYIFISCAVFTAVCLIMGLFSNLYTIPEVKQTYKPATHIGMASDIFRIEKADEHLTDSLTKIMKSWKQH